MATTLVVPDEQVASVSFAGRTVRVYSSLQNKDANTGIHDYRFYYAPLLLIEGIDNKGKTEVSFTQQSQSASGEFPLSIKLVMYDDAIKHEVLETLKKVPSSYL